MAASSVPRPPNTSPQGGDLTEIFLLGVWLEKLIDTIPFGFFDMSKLPMFEHLVKISSQNSNIFKGQNLKPKFVY